MRILLEDGFAITKGTGIGRHTLNLYGLLKNQPGIESVTLLDKRSFAALPMANLRRAVYIVWLNSMLPLHARHREIDIIHFSNYLVPFTRFSDAKYIVTIHDLTAWNFPHTLPTLYLQYIKLAITNAAGKADLIITVSNAVKKEIAARFKVRSDKIRTIYNSASQRFWERPRNDASARKTLARFNIKKDFILFVGVLESRKNVQTLVNAFEEVSKAEKDAQLVLVGRPGYGYFAMAQKIDQMCARGDIVLTGYLSEDELIDLYDSARLFVYPSLYEGFGIPLVEAMIRKVPIIATRIPANEEVAGDAALYFTDPCDHPSLAQHIRGLLSDNDLRQAMVRRGLDRLHRFSWTTIGKAYCQAYHEVHAQPQGQL